MTTARIGVNWLLTVKPRNVSYRAWRAQRRAWKDVYPCSEFSPSSFYFPSFPLSCVWGRTSPLPPLVGQSNETIWCVPTVRAAHTGRIRAAKRVHPVGPNPVKPSPNPREGVYMIRTLTPVRFDVCMGMKAKREASTRKEGEREGGRK